MKESALPGKLGELETLKNLVIVQCNTQYNYYDKQATIFRWLSRLTRTMALGLSIAALWLTFAKVDYPWLNHTFGGAPESAIFFVALTGILVSVDKLFIISNNWKRSTIAKMRIDELINAVEFRWRRVLLEVKETGITDAELAVAMDFFEQKQRELHEVLKVETNTWGDNIDTALSSLKSVLDSTRQQAEEETRRAVARAHQHNATTCIVKLKLSEALVRKGIVTLSLGGATHQREAAKDMVIPDVKIDNGHVIVRLTYKDGEKNITLEKVEAATAGSLLPVSFA